nr:immunoglobulin light chain junction region [Macaca mulatta]
CMQGLELPLSF